MFSSALAGPLHLKSFVYDLLSTDTKQKNTLMDCLMSILALKICTP